MSRNAISANPKYYIFKIFRESIPRTPLKGLKQFFLAAEWLKNFFQDRLPPKQKVLDRTMLIRKLNQPTRCPMSQSKGKIHLNRLLMAISSKKNNIFGNFTYELSHPLPVYQKY